MKTKTLMLKVPKTTRDSLVRAKTLLGVRSYAAVLEHTLDVWKRQLKRSDLRLVEGSSVKKTKGR